MKPIIDISKYEEPRKIDYDTLCNNISGAIIRCSYGSIYDAPYGKEEHFETHYREITKRGIPVGTYLYITAYQPIKNQAKTLVELIHRVGAPYEIDFDKILDIAVMMPVQINTKSMADGFPLGIWADVENESGAPPLQKQMIHEFIQESETGLGYEVGVYTSKYYWSLIMGGAYYTTRKLWCAYYGSESRLPKYIPQGWDTCSIWQYTDSGRLPGYSGGLDINKFMGTEREYVKFITGEDIPDQSEPLTKLWYPCDKSTSYITQYFGENPAWYPTSKGHNGVDFGFHYKIGKNIYAMADGVVEVSREQTGGYGRHIRIRHNHGVTIYGHLSKRLVEVGDTVVGKQLIGLSGGNTDDPYCGYSTGPHLHAEYRWDKPAPQVPGGFVYNAVDIYPLLVEWEEVDSNMLFKVMVIVNGLNVRRGIGTSYPIAYVALNGDILNVYEITNGWYRVGDGLWCSGDPKYTKKVDEGTLEPSDKEKLDKLWDHHPELH